MPEKYIEANRKVWNAKTPVHAASAFYGLNNFKQGWNPLNKIELEELGNVSGKKLLHLQCHFGMDTLAWQRLGAKCTGVDLSDEAVKLARELNEELGLGARFINCNIYDLQSHLDEKFDIVFTSYGTTGWLPDLDNWANIISHFLKPSGIFYIVDFHPVMWMFDDQFKKIVYAYHNAGPIIEETKGTYADRNAPVKNIEYGWNHSLGEVMNSLISHGMTIKHLNEFPYSNYDSFNNMVKGEDGFYRIKGMENKIPVMYSIKAVKN